MFSDYHVHTEFSDDSVYPMEQVIRDAIAMHMDELCFTDHVDYGVKEDWDCGHEIAYRGGEPFANVDYPAYAARIEECREKYGAQITIRFGLEFGMQVHTIPQYQALFQRYPFDFIILSVHQVENKEFWTQDDTYIYAYGIDINAEDGSLVDISDSSLRKERDSETAVR